MSAPVLTTQNRLQQLIKQGYAPNSPEVQAAARAEILRRQQIDAQRERAAENAAELVKAMETGDTEKVTWTKPAASAAAAPKAAPQETLVKVFQPNANIKVEAGPGLQEMNKTVVYSTIPKEKTGNPVLDHINENFDLDNTYISYGQNAQQRAKLLKQSGNSAQQGLADAYLRNNDPKTVGSAAWYEENVGKALSGGRLNLNEKIETGNVAVDILANFGRGVVQVPSSFSRMVTAAGLAVADMAGEAAKGNIKLVGQSLASGPGNFAAGTVQAAVEDPAAFTGNVAGGIVLSGGLKAVTPKIRGITVKTTTTPEITIKNRSIIIETVGEKTTTAGIVKTNTNSKTGATVGKTTTIGVKTETGSAAITRGKTETGTSTVKTGNVEIFTKKRGLTINKETGETRGGKTQNTDIIGKKGPMQQTKYTGRTEKKGNLRIDVSKMKGDEIKVRGTNIRKSSSTTETKISQTANGKTRNATQRIRTRNRRTTAYRGVMKGLERPELEILKDVKTTKKTGKAKADKIEVDERLLPGEVKKTPTITINRGKNTIIIKEENGSGRIGPAVNTNIRATAGEKTATGSKEVFTDKRGTITKRNVTLTNSKTNTARTAGKVKEKAVPTRKQQKTASSGKGGGGTTDTRQRPRQEPQHKPKDQGTRKNSGGSGGLLMKEKPAGQKTQQKTASSGRGGGGTVLTTAKPPAKPKVTGGTVMFRQSKTVQKTVVGIGQTPQTKTTTGNGQVLIVKPEPRPQPQPQTTPTPADRTLVITDTTGTTKPKTDTKEKRKLVVMPAVTPAVRQTQSPARKQKPKQDEVLKKAVAVKKQTKKRLLNKTEEVKRKKNKKQPKKGKNAIRTETVNQFGWLGFDAKPPAKPKLLKLQ